jgi:hypothetical protein
VNRTSCKARVGEQLHRQLGASCSLRELEASAHAGLVFIFSLKRKQQKSWEFPIQMLGRRVSFPLRTFSELNSRKRRANRLRKWLTGNIGSHSCAFPRSRLVSSIELLYVRTLGGYLHPVSNYLERASICRKHMPLERL